MDEELHSRRISYERGALDAATVGDDPFALFGAWFADALRTPEIVEPNAMSVSTADAQGRPSSRIVLLRAWDARGFVFYTNYESRKGAEIAVHPYAALLFWWGALERQIRIEGPVERLGAGESDAYFATRPRGHRLSAWASRQSTEVTDRTALDAAMIATDARFPEDVPRPPFWGGYRVAAERFEFWQGRPNRVHDRLTFVRAGDAWEVRRLSP